MLEILILILNCLVTLILLINIILLIKGEKRK